MIKCACKTEHCIGEIFFEDSSDLVSLYFKNDLVPAERNIYLDANGLIKLIQEARLHLMKLTERGE